MTGFGRKTVETENISFTVELKTLNSKGLDIYCRLPRAVSAKEIEIRNILTAALERGKLECNVTYTRQQNKEASVVINADVIKVYIENIKENGTANGLNLTDSVVFEQAMAMPGAYQSDVAPEILNQEEWLILSDTIQKTIADCNEFRLREGEQLKAKFLECVNLIDQYLQKVKEREVYRIPMVRERLQKAVAELVAEDNIDKNRFEQELVFYIERYDIAEEIQRLTTHINYFKNILEQEGNGKKLNFMAQEMGREINTIGSKANDVELQHLVVNMKEELEKIKEQTANVL